MENLRLWFGRVFVAWAAIFLAYEVLERTLLAQAPPRTLHALHLLRGTVTAFLVASLAVSLTRPPSSSLSHPGLPDRLRWLVRLRWVAVAGVALAVAIAQGGLGLLPPESVPPLVGVVVFMAGYNAVFAVLARRHAAARTWAVAQILLDLAALTALLHFSGGVMNPFFLFFIFHVIIAGILLRRWESYAIGAVAFGLFGGMAVVQHLGGLASYRLQGFPTMPPEYVVGLLIAFAAAIFISTHFITTIIADLRQATADLTREKGTLDGIIQGIGAGLMVVDADDRVTWLNEQASRWFPSVRWGERCHEALAGRALPCEGCDARTGRPCSMDHVRGDRRYLVTQTAVRNATGGVAQRLLLIQDVTAERRMEEQLFQSSKLAAVGTLASGIAHELNNPLASISASADYLRELAEERRLDEPFPRHLERITNHVYRCKEIIDALLGLARREEQERVPTDVNGAIRELARLGGRDLAPRLELAPDGPTALANPRLLQNVVLNLLLNARDAAGEEGRVELRTTSAGDSVAITVQDDGPGIPPENLHRIFEPFFTTKPAGKGTGLGLFLCHRMVEAMGGRVEVASAQGRGTSVTVVLPGASVPEEA